MKEVDKAYSSEYSPGKLLMQGRLSAGLSVEQVAKELYMTASKVKALENNDYGNLNTHTFARGYIRAYANLLKMDVVALLAAYDQYTKVIDEEHALQNIAAKEAAVKNQVPKSKGAWHFLLFIVIFFVGLWLISVWFFDNHTESEYVLPAVNVTRLDSHNIIEKNVTPSSTSSMDFVVSSVASDANLLNVGVGQVQTLSSATSNASVSNTTASASVEAASSSVTVSSQPPVLAVNQSSSTTSKTSLDVIEFSFRAESWLEVSDSRGDVLATELEVSGSKIKLVGKAPFDVKLGNAPKVDVVFNGKKIDVIPLLGSNVLTLKVGD